MHYDRDVKILGILLCVLGAFGIVAAPEIMNSSEVDTLRGIGAAALVVGAIVVVMATRKKA